MADKLGFCCYTRDGHGPHPHRQTPYCERWTAAPAPQAEGASVGLKAKSEVRRRLSEFRAAIIREETGTQCEQMLQLLKDYGTGKWGDNDFDRWIDRKDALLREIAAAAAPDEGGTRVKAE